jgi:hypothetical protein
LCFFLVLCAAACYPPPRDGVDTII